MSYFCLRFRNVSDAGSFPVNIKNRAKIVLEILKYEEGF